MKQIVMFFSLLKFASIFKASNNDILLNKINPKEIIIDKLNHMSKKFTNITLGNKYFLGMIVNEKEIVDITLTMNYSHPEPFTQLYINEYNRFTTLLPKE